MLTGQLIDERYRVGDVVGRGAMSEVYRAEDERLGRTVAIKALRPGVTDRDRFEEETALLCSFDHPNLVRLHDAGEHEGTPYLVLNLLDRTLADELRAGPLPPDRVARIGSETASALHYLHDRGVVHRDIKPSNLLLRADGTACVADLGAALSVDGPRLTATGMTIGTPMYLAPEQATGEDVTSAADIYSLGLVLLEAVTGAPAFVGNQQETLAARLTRSPLVPPEVPSALRSALESMVAVDPSHRPTAAEVGAELHRVAVGPLAAPVTGDAADTAVMAPPTAVGAVVSPRGDTQQMAAAPAAVVVPGAHLLEPVRGWINRDRTRAVWVAVVAALLLVVLVAGLASAGGGPLEDDIGDDPSTTVSTTPVTAAPTTVPTTVAPALPPAQGACGDDCGDDPQGGEGKGKGKGDKDD